MECPLWRLLISSRSVNKHGYNRNLAGSIYGMSSMKIAHFVLIGWQNMATTCNSCFWLVDSKKSSPLKLLSHMNRNLVGSIYMYGRFCIKLPQSRMKGERHKLSPLSLEFIININCLFQYLSDIKYGT